MHVCLFKNFLSDGLMIILQWTKTCSCTAMKMNSRHEESVSSSILIYKHHHQHDNHQMNNKTLYKKTTTTEIHLGRILNCAQKTSYDVTKTTNVRRKGTRGDQTTGSESHTTG